MAYMSLGFAFNIIKLLDCFVSGKPAGGDSRRLSYRYPRANDPIGATYRVDRRHLTTDYDSVTD